MKKREILVQVLAALLRLEQHMATQDESFAAFKAATDANFAEMDANFANIVADETNILNQLKTIGQLSPANQAILDAAVAALTARVAKSKAIADTIPDATVQP